MGKISSNLITEKALRATRVNKALKDFFKAHGGKFITPDTIPEHLAFTASISSPSDYSPNGSIKVARKVLKYTPGKGTGTYTNSMFDKNASRYVANALNKATGGKLFREYRKTAPYDQNLPGYDNLLKKYQGTEKGNDYLIKRIDQNSKPSFNKQSSLARGVANSVYGVMANAASVVPIPDATIPYLRAQHHPEDLSSFGTAVPINDEGTLYINPDTGVTTTDIKIGSNGEEYYRVDPNKSLYKPVYGSGEAIEEDALNSLKDTHISADQLARNNIAKAKAAKFNKTADYLNDIISGVIKNIPQDISKLPLPPVSADTAQPVQPVVKPKRMVRPPVVNNTPVANVTPVQPPVTNTSTPVAAPTLSSVVPQAVRHNGGFDNYRRESVLSALRAAGGISPAEAVQRGIIPWEALNYV